ncbi:hypothetical protein CHS0354_034262 [Potamilus streckersoni]|uniref:Uncharacterized protein n=1 Tax=Potamilus streckersoni TaxID=2493646 RepID=A0AAE0S4J7_9BIVA|nr:hypothetical protein CHS0354_034262 [Potamilus streckersoni]
MMPPELILFEVFIIFSTIASVQRRREAITNTLKQIEEDCVAVVSKRMKSVKIYFDKPPRKIIQACMCSRRLVRDVNLRANKKSIILKQSDGSMYMGDPYWYQTIERYLEHRANRKLRRLALLEYNHLKEEIVQCHGNLDKVDSTDNTEYQGKRLAPSHKGKNHICKLCSKKHVGYDKYRCYRERHAESTVIVVEDAKYSQPGISSNHADNINVAEGRGASSTAFNPFCSVQFSPFSNFQTRLSTFKSWRSHQNPRHLAEHGFFYKGVGDTITCYSCGVALKHWDPDDDPLLEHIRYSPTCNHLENTLGWKTIQEYLDQIRNDAKMKIGFNTGVVTMDGGDRTVTTKLTEDYHKENTGSLTSARSPEYQSLEVRLSTFAKFPNYNEISIQDLAKAGFYYTGLSDVVRCYWCDLGLKNWDYGDDPTKEHAKYKQDCVHLRSVKGEDFIKQTQNEAHLPKTYTTSPRWSLSASPRERVSAGKREIERQNFHEDVQEWNWVAQGQSSDKQKLCSNFLCTPAAQSVLEHGYTDEKVLAAIKKLNIKDETKLTAKQILEVIFDAEENGIDLVENDSTYESQKYQSKNVQSPNEAQSHALNLDFGLIRTSVLI